VDVGSPFDYEHQALLYCAAHLPDPRATGHEAAMLEELESLVRAAGGRTLALFTSRRAMVAAAEHLRDRLPFTLLVQDELPRPLLQGAFLDDEQSVLLATMGFWQGFDAPGRTCSLVVIDRLPFARPDDPLAEARRSAATRARQNAFVAVDLPAAAVLLAQGAGRLIRAAADRGVVAVLDPRLATASYRWTLVKSLPPMRRTKDPDEVRRVLAAIDGPVAIDR
jgi:ATP-dependent DNA helicase DinG